MGKLSVLLDQQTTCPPLLTAEIAPWAPQKVLGASVRT